MATITELALFKMCAQSINTNNLNLDRIAGPVNKDEYSEDEIKYKKTIKLFHMCWSGITKYLR